MKRRFLVFFSLLLTLTACHRQKDSYEAVLPSPDFNVHLYFNLFNGNPYYMVYHGQEKLLAWSILGFRMEGGPDLTTGMVLDDRSHPAPTEDGSKGEPFFEGLKYNSLSVRLTAGRKEGMAYTIDLRCFNPGIAFRYRFDSAAAREALALHEATEFTFDTVPGGLRVAGRPDTLAGRVPEEFILPVDLAFGRGEQVTILETDAATPSSLMWMADPANRRHFRLDARGGNGNEGLNGGPPATPWRILVINKTNPDE